MNMPRKTFDSELEELHNEFIEMGTMIEKAIAESIDAFRNGDAERARKVSKNDYSVNKLEQTIQSNALTILLRQQPVAGDLRKVSAALKVAGDMERIGDQGADIADLAVRLAESKTAARSVRIDAMAERAAGMVRECVKAFTEGDTELAKHIIIEDDELDDLFNDVKNETAAALRNDADADGMIDLLMIAKHFEKIGDHAVNIAEWTIFCDTGILNDVRLL